MKRGMKGEHSRGAACLRLRCAACLAVLLHEIGGAADAEAKSGSIISDVLENKTNNADAQCVGKTHRFRNELKRG
eukprot:3187438-Pleurochrysis_carterae.AAC.1